MLINKPGGLLTLPKHALNKDSVRCRLVKDYPTATMLHRLGFGTSGIMVVALNKQINGQLTKQFQARNLEKTYTAIWHGHLPKDEVHIDFPIAKGDLSLQKFCHETGK
ncbi:MAG: pseudouridine synthase [Amphritea sp.]